MSLPPLLLTILETLGIFIELPPIGQGGFHYVFAGQVDGKRRAIRISKRSLEDPNSGDVLRREIDRLQDFKKLPSRPYLSELIRDLVVAVPGEDDRDFHYLVSVWALADGDLGKAYGEGRVTDEELLDHLSVIAQAIDFLNNRGFRHRDVSPGNILWFDDGGGVCLGDFGILRLASLTEEKVTIIFNPAFAPPEAQDGVSHVTHDLYSLAATYVYLITGKTVRAFKEQLTAGATLLGFGKNESRVLAAALHPDPRQRMRDGAVAWMRLLREALKKDAEEKTQPLPDAITVELPAAPAMSKPREALREAKNLAFDLCDRLANLQPPSLIDTIMFRVKMHPGHRPSHFLTQSERSQVLVEWARSPNGCGLEELRDELDRLRYGNR